jgi:Uma2 family endonuclease
VLLVTPAAVNVHQRVIEQLFLQLAPQVHSRALGEMRCLAADIRLHPGSLVQPDLFVIPPAGDGRPVRDWSEVTALRLAVEVLSPSTARYDRGLKRRYYQRALVEEYWIVDLEARLVERWRPDDDRPEILSQTLTWQPSGADEPLVVDLVALFRGALGD